MMNSEEKQAMIEHLRSLALLAHEAINALKSNNYGQVSDLLADCRYDLDKAEEIITEQE